MGWRASQLETVACAILAILLALPAAAEHESPLQLGVLPNLSARQVLVTYRPLLDHLSETLSRRIELSTAPGFAAFHDRTASRDYDIVVTASNLARLAELDHGCRPLAILDPPITGVLVMHVHNPIGAVEQLHGRSIAFANPQSAIALRAMLWLEDRGIAVGSTVRAIEARNEDSVSTMLTDGRAMLAIMSRGELRALEPASAQGLVIFAEIGNVPGFVVLSCGSRTTERDVEALRASLHGFSDSAHGRRFFALSGFHALRAIRSGDLAEVDPLLERTRLMLRRR